MTNLSSSSWLNNSTGQGQYLPPPEPPERAVGEGDDIIPSSSSADARNPSTGESKSMLISGPASAPCSHPSHFAVDRDPSAPQTTGIASGALADELATEMVSLMVGIRERVPEAVVTANDPSRGPRVTLVDPSGTPFAPAGADDVEILPHLIPSGAVSAGEPDARLALALALAKRLPAHGLPGDLEIFIAPRSDPEGLALRLPGLPGRVVIGWEDFDARLERLTALLAADLTEVAEAARIDLRFADQAVLQSPRPGGAEQAAAARGVAVPSTETPAG